MITQETINNRYHLHELLGTGGMGAVYRTSDRLTGNTVALKRVLVGTESLSFTSKTNSFGGLVALAHEFRTLAGLRHPNVINVLDYGVDQNRQPFFIMDLLNNARTITETAQPLNTVGKINLLIQLLEALIYLHRRGIIHCDIKPGNVLVVEGQVKVLDFGLSLATERIANYAGTIDYMAPEILQNTTPTPQSDHYAVGVIAYEMFAGQVPFKENDFIGILKRMPDYSLLEELACLPVIMRLLSKEPVDRYDSAREVIQAFCESIGCPTPPELVSIRESYLQAARFVGRKTEIDSLVTQLQATISQQTGQLILVGGESGIGKSRLLDELRIQALIEGIMVVRGQAIEGGGLPYQLWRDILPRLLLNMDVTDRQAGILKEIVPDIDNLLGRTIPEPPKVSNDILQKRLSQVVQEIFQAQTEPILLMLEDLQWEQGGLTLLETIAISVTELPIMIVASYRTDEAPTLSERFPQAQSMLLNRLSYDAIASLCASMVGRAGLQPDFVEYIYQQTEGNAFFVVEVLRYLAEEAERLENIPSLKLPEDILARGMLQIVQRRLDALPPTYVPVLQLATVAGRVLNFNVLQHCCPTIDLDEWLTRSVNTGFIEYYEEGWRFSHDKIRQGVQEFLSDAERVALHQQWAQALEHFYADEPSWALVIADHWRDAHDPQREAYYAHQAAEYLAQIDLDLSRALSERALACNPHDPDLRCKLLCAVGNAHLFFGDYQQAALKFEEALQIALEHGFRHLEVHARIVVAELTHRSGNYPEALQSFETALAIAHEIHDLQSQTDVLQNLSVLLRFMGKHEQADQRIKACVEIMRQLDDPFRLAKTLYAMSVISRNAGRFEEAITQLNESIVIYRELGTILDLSHSYNNLGICQTMTGAFDEAYANLLHGKELRAQAGVIRGEASSSTALADYYWAKGDYENAHHFYKIALELWQSFHDRWNITNSHADIVFSHLQRGERDEALSNLHEALRASYEINAGFVVVKSLIGYACLARYDGDFERVAYLLASTVAYGGMTAPLRLLRWQPLVDYIETQNLTLPQNPEIDFDDLVVELLKLE